MEASKEGPRVALEKFTISLVNFSNRPFSLVQSLLASIVYRNEQEHTLSIGR